jgi:hypothetical protein
LGIVEKRVESPRQLPEIVHSISIAVGREQDFTQIVAASCLHGHGACQFNAP